MTIKKLIKKIIPKRAIDVFMLKIWERQGKPIPPPHRVKQLAIEEYQKTLGINILVETGTYMGDMVYAMKDKFQKIYSVELDFNLWRFAVKRFKNQNHIVVLQGDSGKVLLDIVPQIKEKAIFWLDGHYSAGITAKADKDCPIFEELAAIFGSRINHVLLIDDARCFNGAGDYPTVEKLSEFILSKRIQSKIEVKDDIIRVIVG
jgi:hypothetical protein